MRKLIKIEEIEEFPVYDITVEDDHCFELWNDVIAHNCLYPKTIMSGGCLLAGTNIQMADGTLKSVEHIKEGELVKTLDGNKPVVHTWTPDTLEVGTPECYEIEFDDGYKVVCSETHKFLINGKWVEVRDLIGNEEVDHR